MLRHSASFDRNMTYAETDVVLSEVISALTFALDLTENAVPGHSLRTCLLGMRIAEVIGLPEAQHASLYYALLLKDIGDADHISRMSRIMRVDDRRFWVGDHLTSALGTNPLLLERLWQEVLPGVAVPQDIGRLAGLAAQHGADLPGLIQEEPRSAKTLRHLNMSEATIGAVTELDERWDGSGVPLGRRGAAISLLARICSIAQTLDAFATEHGQDAALRMIRARRGTWFDPDLVRAVQVLHTSGRLWQHCQPRNVESTRVAVLRLDPSPGAPLSAEFVDRICEAFGDLVDAKSPFTFHHSVGVTEVSVAVAREMELPEERVSLVRRAAFLHDIGKLAVPNHILDKTGKLDAHEWLVVTRHPNISGSILARVGAFREIASLAAEHHERLDGSGYPFGLCSDQLSVESRIIALSDCYAAMAEDRPYRAGLDPQEIYAEIGRELPHRIDACCFAALRNASGRWPGSMPAAVKQPPPCPVVSEKEMMRVLSQN